MTQKIVGTNIEIDESEIIPPAGAKPSKWTPPREVFFGRRDPESGEMEQKPVYVYQEYPRAMYKLESTRTGPKLRVVNVNNDEEKQVRFDAGFKLTMGEWGIVTAPSHEELIAIQRMHRGIEEDAEALVDAPAPLKLVKKPAEEPKPVPKKRKVKRAKRKAA